MKEHPRDCPGDICDEYTCEARKAALRRSRYSFPSPSPLSPSSPSLPSPSLPSPNPQTVVACLNCSPHCARSPAARCGHINQFCRTPQHEPVFCAPDTWRPKTWQWREHETDCLGETVREGGREREREREGEGEGEGERPRHLYEYQKLKENFERVAYPPTPATQWAPCNTEWQLLRNENATMHYVGGRTRVTLRVWACSGPSACCEVSPNGLEHGFFNFDNRNLFEAAFLDLLRERASASQPRRRLSIPAAFHALARDYEICHDDMPGLPISQWNAVLECYEQFPRTQLSAEAAVRAALRSIEIERPISQKERWKEMAASEGGGGRGRGRGREEGEDEGEESTWQHEGASSGQQNVEQTPWIRRNAPFQIAPQWRSAMPQ